MQATIRALLAAYLSVWAMSSASAAEIARTDWTAMNASGARASGMLAADGRRVAVTHRGPVNSAGSSGRDASVGSRVTPDLRGVVGSVHYAGGQPVRQPGTLALLGIGLLGVALAHRRTQRGALDRLHAALLRHPRPRD